MAKTKSLHIWINNLFFILFLLNLYDNKFSYRPMSANSVDPDQIKEQFAEGILFAILLNTLLFGTTTFFKF